MPVIDIKLNNYQDKFLFNDKRYSALIASVGTGKTFSLLYKAYKHCQDYPNSLGLIIRKEFTDLRDSTIKDFERYFNVSINAGNKEYTFKNGSKVMFRHGDLTDMNVLKNINLSFFEIEQAEEYENEVLFDFLRDRLRRQGSPRWGAVIANAKGHNWIWKRFVNGADIVEVNRETAEFEYYKDDYICCTASSFANAHNLPDDFIKDLRKMEVEAPEHFYQYIMNSFEYTESDEFLFSQQDFGIKIVGSPTGRRIAGLDVARYGNDKSSFTVLEDFGNNRWKEIAQVRWGKQPVTYTTGRTLELCEKYKVELLTVDGDGIGGGAVDVLRNSKFAINEYRGGLDKDADYFNARSRDYFELHDALLKGELEINSPEIIESLLTIKYTFQGDRQKRIIGKNEMRAKGYHSPDDADSAMMAYAGRKQLQYVQAQKRYSGHAREINLNDYE